MASESETYQIILAIQGEEQVERLRASVALAEQRYRSFQEAQRSGQVGSAAVDAQREAYARLRRELGQAEESLGRLGRGGRGGGQALMEFSRAAEDAQYGQEAA